MHLISVCSFCKLIFLTFSLLNNLSTSNVNKCRITGAESVVYQATLYGKKVAVKKPILSTSEDIDRFHTELQLLWSLSLSLYI
jgi:hypothetical protein